MSFLNKFSDGTLRVAYTALALFCFMYASVIFIQTMFTDRMTSDDCLWIEEVNGKKLEDALLITQILPGGNTDEAGIKDGDILIELGGQKFKSSLEAQKILNSFDAGEMIKYKVIRGSEVIETEVKVYKVFNALFLIFSLLGFGFLFIGHIVGYSKPKELTSQLFFFLGCAAVCGFVNVGQMNIPLMSNPILIVSTIGMILFFPLFLHFFLSYPTKREFQYRKLILGIAYAIPIVLIISIRLINSSEIKFIRISSISNVIFISYVITGIAFFLGSYIRIKDESQRKPLRIVLYGFLIALAGFLYTGLLPLFIDKPNFLIQPWIYLPSALVLAIPLSFGFSIVKYRILDTEFIVKKGLVFGIITAFIVGIYLLLVLVLDSLLGQFLPQNKQILTIAMIVIVTFSFDFVNNKAKEFVDKQLYRERYNYRKSLLEFSEELPYQTNIRQIIDTLGTSIRDTMGISTLNVWFKDPEYYLALMADYAQSKDKEKVVDQGVTFDKAITALFKDDKEAKFLTEVYLDDYELDKESKEAILSESYVLSIPIHIKDDLVGALNFGEKPSGKAYSEEDIDLLKTLASQAAIAFENSRLQQEKISKQKIEEELHIARKIQMGLLPQAIDSIEGIEVSGFYNPAKLIGGDFYDVIRLSDTKMLVVVADVSGKGIPAAIYMSKVQAMIQFASVVFKTPKEILIEVNKLIHQKIDRKSFITTVVALFDLDKMVAKICRAGHNPVIYSVNGKFEFLKSRGMGLGLDTEHYFEDVLEEIELPISAENLFIFYSDGLTEAMNHNREEFGTDKVFDIVAKNRHLPCVTIQKELIDSVSEFRAGAEQNDDITLVVARISGNKFSKN
jgi:sigma-B regulation protein RsbU (phosphoserine phosphatase)